MATWMRRARLLALGLAVALGAAGCEPQPWTWSFVVIADPHISNNAEHDARLQDAIDWINANREAEKVELVVIVGDIAWGAGEVDRVRAMLDELTVPWVPVMGDNEIHNGDEEQIVTDWLPTYDDLAATLDGWSMAPVPVWNPELETESWFVNFTFSHRDTRFLAADFASRVMDPILGEQAELHDFAGGTMPWFTSTLAATPSVRDESIVMLTHHPMHQQAFGAFSAAELDAIKAQTSPRADEVFANFAGHYHVNLEVEPPGAGYRVFVTDATWDDANQVRVVRVLEEDSIQSYDTEVVDVAAGASARGLAPWRTAGGSFEDWLLE